MRRGCIYTCLSTLCGFSVAKVDQVEVELKPTLRTTLKRAKNSYFVEQHARMVSEAASGQGDKNGQAWSIKL